MCLKELIKGSRVQDYGHFGRQSKPVINVHMTSVNLQQHIPRSDLQKSVMEHCYLGICGLARIHEK